MKSSRSLTALAATLALLTAIVPMRLYAGDGAELYKAKCASCHGAAGAADSGVGRALKLRALGSPEVQKQTDPQLGEVIAKGKAKMPAYQDKFSKQQLKDVVAFVRTLKK